MSSIVASSETLITGIPSGAALRSVWNFYPSREAAEAYLDANRARLEADYGSLKLQTYDEFERERDAEIASWPMQEIDAEAYGYAFEVLPPSNWDRQSDFERFIVPEAFTGLFYHQYAQRGDRYFKKLVHARDRTTWMTPESVDSFAAEATCVPSP